MNPADFTFTLPFGIGGMFDPLFEDAGDLSMQIFDKLSYFTYILAFAGLLMAAYHLSIGGDFAGLGNQLMMTAIIAVCLHFVVTWVLDAQNVLGFNLLDQFDADLGEITEIYTAKVATWVAAEAAAAFLSGSPVTMVIACVMIVLVVIGVICVWLGVVVAYIFQSLSIVIGIALIPIFLGMFLFPNTKETGIKYFWGLGGIMMWPLGWGIGFRLINTVSDLWDTLLLMLGPLTALDLLFGGIVTGSSLLVEAILYWTVLTKAPKLIEAAVISGSQLGSGMMAAGAAGVTGAAGTAISTVGAAAGAAISAVGTVAAPATGGASLAVGAAASSAVSSGSKIAGDTVSSMGGN
jgi:hypothetical protein